MIQVRIPYFVTLHSFKSDASESFEKSGVLFFSPDLTAADICWDINEQVFENNFQNLLKFYRSEYSYVPDGDYEKAVPMKPFLLEDEKGLPPEPMSFDLVKRAFLKEFSRRFDEYIAAGNEPYIVEPPEMLKTPEARKEYFDTMPPKKNTYWEDNVMVEVDDL
jgi:hypothetical protein